MEGNGSGHRVDGIQLLVTMGQWRGTVKVGEKSTATPISLFAKDDDEPLPWGRALEEALEELLQKADSTSEEAG